MSIRNGAHCLSGPGSDASCFLHVHRWKFSAGPGNQSCKGSAVGRGSAYVWVYIHTQLSLSLSLARCVCVCVRYVCAYIYIVPMSMPKK